MWSGNASQVRAQLGFHSATDGGFYSRLTARENLNFFAAMNNLFDAEAARRLDELTELMGMGDFPRKPGANPFDRTSPSPGTRARDDPPSQRSAAG